MSPRKEPHVRLRLVLSVAALVAAAAVPSYGAMRPMSHLVDPKGDAKGNFGFLDIVSGNFSTAGRGEYRELVATLTLAGAPRTDAGFTYVFGAEVRGCGHVEFQYTPVSAQTAFSGEKSFYMFCDSSVTPSSGTQSLHEEVSVSVSGRTITWSVPLVMLPPGVGVGALYTDFEAVADVAEPVVGSPLLGIPNQSVDMGYGASTWRIR